MYESVTDEFTDSTNPISKNSAWICHIQLKLWPFCDIFAYFSQKLAAMATSLRPLQSEMSSLDWPTTKSPAISHQILAISRRNAFICIYCNFCPKIGCHGNAPLSLVYGSVTYEFPGGTNPISKPNSAWICCIQLKLWPFLCFWLFRPKFGCHGNAP